MQSKHLKTKQKTSSQQTTYIEHSKYLALQNLYPKSLLLHKPFSGRSGVPFVISRFRRHHTKADTSSLFLLYLLCRRWRQKRLSVINFGHTPVVTSCFHGHRVRRRPVTWYGDKVSSLSRVVRLHTGWGVGNGLRNYFGCGQHHGFRIRWYNIL